MPPSPFRVGTWNVGGLTAQNVLELTKSFAGDRDLETLQVLMMQEVIAEPGLQFLEDHGWTLVFGKNSRDWRGTAIAFRSSTAKHTNSTLLPGGIATTLTQSTTRQQATRYIAGHIPHHATIAQAEAMLGGWQSTLTKPKVILGVDANETYTDPDQQGWRAHTGRGELVLATLDGHGFHTPPQELPVPTYHPYNTAMESRRLDYVFCKGQGEGEGKVRTGSRHMASSDHDLVLLDLPARLCPARRQAQATWGGRRYAKGVDPQQEASNPPTQTDTHTAISLLAKRITEQGRPSRRFHESPALRALRQQARVGWQHTLTDDAHWKSKLATHFRGIFAKAPVERTRRRLQDTRGALTQLCKRTRWHPFTRDDLQLATRTWKNNKATGPDSITHELLRQLLQDPQWEGRILHMVNDFLYKGEIPAPVQQGMTRVVRHAKEWGVPTWLVKLDVRKAFDSVWQESMGDMVAQRIGGLRNHRARKAFHKHAALLCAATPLKGRLTLHQTLVRGAALWGGQAWPVTDGILKAVNTTQLLQIRRMMHPARRAGELWEDWAVSIPLVCLLGSSSS
ncbi:TTLL6, partial [Symbiodinium microadriaticum]